MHLPKAFLNQTRTQKMQSEKKVVSLFGKSKQGHNMFTPSENENNKHCNSEIRNFDPKSECESEF